ncbi:hypothetical protein M758_5G108300 [Ceratodon purpureus]|nr:hypothetical protein M758_5G108300 [Ceratodon purpureus]
MYTPHGFSFTQNCHSHSPLSHNPLTRTSIATTSPSKQFPHHSTLPHTHPLSKSCHQAHQHSPTLPFPVLSSPNSNSMSPPFLSLRQHVMSPNSASNQPPSHHTSKNQTLHHSHTSFLCPLPIPHLTRIPTCLSSPHPQNHHLCNKALTSGKKATVKI